MKLAALLLLPLLAFAAPWDGTRGPFSLVTITSPGTANLPIGLPSVPGVPDSTTIFIRCANPEVTGVRLTVIYRDGSGAELEMRLLSDFNAWGFGGANITVPQSQIVSVKLTELRNGPSY